MSDFNTNIYFYTIKNMYNVYNTMINTIMFSKEIFKRLSYQN